MVRTRGLIMMLAVLPVGNAETCDEVAFAFSLTNLDTVSTESFPVPQRQCFYPVTVQALLDSGHREYSWVPPNKIPKAHLNLAPSGAFVYKMNDKSILFKSIAPVSADDPNAVLKFSNAVTWSKEDTFADVSKLNSADPEIKELQQSIECFEADITLNIHPFDTYRKFVWTSEAFKYQGGCGAYVYEEKPKGIVYHACCPAPAIIASNLPAESSSLIPTIAVAGVAGVVGGLVAILVVSKGSSKSQRDPLISDDA